MFLITALASVMAAAFGGMFRHSGDEDVFKGRFVLLTLLAPVGLLILLATCRWLFGPRKPKRPKW